MIRKRDFVLFVVAVLFLLVGIGTTVSFSETESIGDSQTYTHQEITGPYQAEVVTSEIDRASRAKELREKIAQLGGTISQAEEQMFVEPDDASGTEVTESKEGLLLCESVREVTFEMPFPVVFKDREGARLLITEKEMMVEQTVGSSTELVSEMIEEVVVQLPARRMPLSGESCIETDVVGIAQDGSLIRNTDARLYGVFGQETVVGYALDGFPIYGTYEGTDVDQCGGTMVNGQYRYYLSSSRDTVINCYSGIPINL